MKRYLLVAFLLQCLALSAGSDLRPVITILPGDDAPGDPARTRTLVWSTEPGVRYALEESEDLSDPDAWVTVAGFPAEAVALTQQHTLELADVADRRFFRVVRLMTQTLTYNLDTNPGWFAADAWGEGAAATAFDSTWVDGSVAAFSGTGGHTVDLSGNATVRNFVQGVTGLLTLSSATGPCDIRFSGPLDFTATWGVRISTNVSIQGDFTMTGGWLRSDWGHAAAYSGTATIRGGTFQFAHAAQGGPNSNFIVDGGTFRIQQGDLSIGTLQLDSGLVEVGRTGSGVAATSLTVAALSGSGGIIQRSDNTADTTARPFTVNQSSNTVFAGEIQGLREGGIDPRLQFTKTGSGNLTLSGVLNLVEQTNVTGGGLFINGTDTFFGDLSGSTAISVNNATLGGTGTIGVGTNDHVVLGANGRLAAGLEGAAGRTTYALAGGTLNLSAATTSTNMGWLKFDLGSAATAGTAYDQIRLTGGALNIGDGLDFNDFDFNLLSGFGPGTYTLFDTDASILGTLGTATGELGEYTAALSIHDNSNLVLTVFMGGPETTWLVQDGQPHAEIVIAEQPARMTNLAANELQRSIEKITGAILPIVTEPSGAAARIYVGISPYTEALGLDTEGLDYGAFRMASGSDWLALLGPDREFVPISPWRSKPGAEGEWDLITGNTFSVSYTFSDRMYNVLGVYAEDDAGTFNAVAEFLRGLGMRWYMPGEIGEVVPQVADLALPVVYQTVRPDFELRHVEFWSTGTWTEADWLWSLRLGLFQGHGLWPTTQPVHGMKFVHGRDEYKAQHPEHYALWDGVRAMSHSYNYGAPCLSAAGLLEHHVEYARAMFDHYGEAMVSIDPVDGYGRGICECEDCEGLDEPERGAGGRMSEYVWSYVNRVAEELYQSHPDRKVSGLAYSSYQDTPRNIEDMSPNMVLLINAARFHDEDARATWRQRREDWLAILPSREIYATGHFYTHALPTARGLPDYYTRLVADSVRELAEDVRGERTGVYTHGDRADHDYHDFAIQHLNFYVTTRLWWDLDLDLDALLDEYYALFYGPAAEEMKAFIEYSEAHVMHMRRDVERIDGAQALFEAAQRAVVPGTVYAERVQLVADYLLLDKIRDAAQQRREDVPRLRVLGQDYSHTPGVPWTLSGKTLDGRLDNEEHWPPLDRFHPLVDVVSGAAPTHSTRIRVFVRSDKLYFGIRCEEPDMANLNLGAPENGDEGIREGDFVELLLETACHSYYRITVNPDGLLIDADCSEGVNTAWTSNADAAVHHGEGFWNVEIRVPVAGEDARMLDPLIGVCGRTPTEEFPWYFNVVRQRVRDDEVERSAFSPTGEDRFDVLDRFAEMWSKYGK